MKFSIQLPEFQRAIQQCLPAIPPKSTLYVLEHMYFSLDSGNLLLVATDQELTISTTISVMGIDDGACLIPARKLWEIVKALGSEGMVELTSDPKSHAIKLRTSFGDYNIKGMGIEEFPQMPEFPTGTSTTLTKLDVQKIAQKTAFAVSSEEYRPAMTGVLFEFTGEKLTTVATDGYRLVKYEVMSDDSVFPTQLNAIVPARAVELLSKADDDTVIAINKTHAQFITNATTIVTRLIDEKFPPYDNVIPKDNDKHCSLRQPELLQAIKRISIFTSSTSPQIKLAINQSHIEVSAEDNESGNQAKESLPCEYAHEPMEVGFNYKYLEEAINHINADDTEDFQIQLSFSTPTRAVLIRPTVKDSKLLMLVMPMRIS